MAHDPVITTRKRPCPFIWIDKDLITTHGRTIGPIGIAVYATILTRMDQSISEPPTVWIAERLGVDPFDVLGALRSLEACGLITITIDSDGSMTVRVNS